MPAEPQLTQIERDKREIDPDFDFRDIARRPFHDITTNEIGMFKWSGVYHQLQKGFFMIRLRLPGGLITADQLDRAADLAAEYAQGQLCITTRQTLQFHWIRKEDIHKVLEGMAEVGLTSRNACGDVSRNVVACSLQGVCPQEIGDTRRLLDTIADDLELLDQQRNLPRKHKISVSGCGRACGQTLMNCQGWHPVKRVAANGREVVGWRFHAGGGLGARPFMAKVVFDWVPEDLVLDVVRATTEVFRRRGNRRVRAYARLKIVVDKLGAKEFGEAVLDVLQERGVAGLDRIEFARESTPDVGDMFLDGQPVIGQRQAGFSTVRIIVPRSEMSDRDARQFANWARSYGSGQMMLTNRQNLELRFVHDGDVPRLLEEIHEAGHVTEGHERLPDMVACVGTTQCNLAVSDTPNTWRRLHCELVSDRDWWERIGPLRINMNGCPNSCGQHWIADIGLRGTRRREEAGSEEGFDVFVGGRLSGAGHVAEHVAQVAAADVVPAVRKLLDYYVQNRHDSSETFEAFARRQGVAGFATALEENTSNSESVSERNRQLRPLFERTLGEALSNES